MNLLPRAMKLWMCVVLFVSCPLPLAAAHLRFSYRPDPTTGRLLPPSQGERLTLGGWVPFEAPPPRATHLVSFRHPATGRTVSIPLRLPVATPRMEYVGNRTIFNYGSDTVEVHFFPDGSLEAHYNTGLLRAP